MRFLIDQDVYAVSVSFLSGLGHDVVTASQLGLAQADDMKLLEEARTDGRILVTRDRDFGGLVFLHGAHSGVIYLRMSPATQILCMRNWNAFCHCTASSNFATRSWSSNPPAIESAD